MKLEDKVKQSPVISLFVSVASGLIIGGGSNYLAARQAISSQEAKIANLEDESARHTARIDAIERTLNATTERMVRVETKIDLLLER